MLQGGVCDYMVVIMITVVIMVVVMVKAWRFHVMMVAFWWCGVGDVKMVVLSETIASVGFRRGG